VRRWTELAADRKKWKDCSTGQSPEWAVVPIEEEKGEEEEEEEYMVNS